LITFLACAANITLLGIGGAFWGLMIGLVAGLILNARRSPQPLPERRHTQVGARETGPQQPF
jgi:benzoate membrane transport protein